MHMHWFTAKTARLLPQARQDDLVLMYSLLAMYIRVTCGTELNRVLLGIVSAPASELFMVVNFKVLTWAIEHLALKRVSIGEQTPPRSGPQRTRRSRAYRMLPARLECTTVCDTTCLGSGS